MRKHFGFIIIFLALCHLASAQTTSSWLNDLCDSVRIKSQVPALQCAVIVSDSVQFGSSGFQSVENQQKVSINQPFHLGSNSKAVTSYIAFRLIEEGKITLNTRFFDLVPDVKKRRWRYRKITLGQLLNHTARIPAYTSGTEFEKIPDWVSTLSAPGQRLGFASLVLRDKPTKRGRHYSNAGYALASLMLERASSMTFEALVEKYLGELNATFASGFPIDMDPNYPKGHWLEGDKLIAHDSGHVYQLPAYMLAAGNMNMNLVDYSKFVQDQMMGLHHQKASLQSKNYHTLHYGKKGYAYGWGNQISDRDSLSFHDGSAGTFYCHTIISAKREIAIIIFANSGQINNAHHGLRNAILAELKTAQ